MKRLALIIAVALSLVGLTSPIYAFGEEHIETFRSDVYIGKDGVANIIETIDYDFGSNYHHGIYRDIPIDYEDGKGKYYINFGLQKITDGSGNSLQYSTSVEDGNQRLKIGDPDRTITGLHRYVIQYNLNPIIYTKDGKLFLNLDVYGGGWTVPANRFLANVTLAKGSELTNVRWYGIGAENLGSATNIALDNIPAYSPITVNANLPDGYTNNLLEEGKKRPFNVWAFIGEFSAIFIILFVFGAIAVVSIMRWASVRAKRKAQTVIPEYDPPMDMLPAEIGLLQDDITDAKEITASIIDWAIRGGLKIERSEKKGFFGKSVEYTLKKGTVPATMTSEESSLFDAIFASGESVKVKDLKIPTAVQTYRTALKNRLTEKGYYQKEGNLLLRGTLTDEGAKQWAKVDGFKLYLGVTEKDRLKFTDAPDKTPERFSKLLPYAIAFGVEKEWAKQFEGIDLSESTGWYSGGNLSAFSADALASDIGSSFASTVSSNSSFSSSGGSAGGGSGGGGGGSW